MSLLVEMNEDAVKLVSSVCDYNNTISRLGCAMKVWEESLEGEAGFLVDVLEDIDGADNCAILGLAYTIKCARHELERVMRDNPTGAMLEKIQSICKINGEQRC